MKLAEALSIVQKAPVDAPPFTALLACGFTPLHLQNYLAAHLQKALPARKVRVSTGLYDDLAGTIERFGTDIQAAAVAIEWADLDPRLGFRQLGGWGARVTGSILESVSGKLRRIEAGLAALPPTARVAVSLPTLPLPPGFHTNGWQASEGELAIEEQLTAFAHRIALIPPVSIVNGQRLNAVSPHESRYDFRSDLHAGFPYTLAHADALASGLAGLLAAAQPKKGIITDLDDTLWFGIVGEAGHENVSWDLASHTQIHGLYQQMLGALADQGVLVAIASKNSPEVVEKALARPDLVVSRDKIFPVEVHWEAKSGSVGRILKAWNISADSVVFVDDSPMELEEVRAAHPGIECILFPKSDYPGALALLRRLRDLFGKQRLSEEDAYRLQSIRQSQQFTASGDGAENAEAFLATAEATITLEYNPPASDTRVVELVNKTNQFNLNGIRYTDAEWHESLADPESFAIAVSYQDKFGPLGKIGVLRGRQKGRSLHIESWVMSCRAFSRRIEYQCLGQLFRAFDADEVIFHFRPTPKNRPTQDFLTGLLKEPATDGARLTRAAFEADCPQLYHTVLEKNAEQRTALSQSL